MSVSCRVNGLQRQTLSAQRGFTLLGHRRFTDLSLGRPHLPFFLILGFHAVKYFAVLVVLNFCFYGNSLAVGDEGTTSGGVNDDLTSQKFGWQTIAATGTPTARHEASMVAFQDQLYLIGGRRINPVDRFDPETKSWTSLSVTPMELHHFQAVVMGDAIYLVGAMTGKYPNETPLEKVIIYYPLEDRFEYGHTIPEGRRRGAAGAVAYDGKIYIVGGITNGHQDGFQPWLDCYDPATGDWTVLEDAAHARDHFQAVVIDHRLYAVAGRTTFNRTQQGFSLTVAAVDVYDLKAKAWLPAGTCPDLPTKRAGNMAANINGKLVVGGGECSLQQQAHSEVEAYNPATKKWSAWPELQRGRHGSGFAIINKNLYTASGSGNRGGRPELDSIEVLNLQARPER